MHISPLTRAALQLSYENNEAVAAELAKEFGAAENDVILSVALAAVPGKEAFDLGQLSGKVKDLLSMQEEIKFKAIKSTSWIVCLRAYVLCACICCAR